MLIQKIMVVTHTCKKYWIKCCVSGSTPPKFGTLVSNHFWRFVFNFSLSTSSLISPKKSNYAGVTANSLINWFSPEAHIPTYWSPVAFYFRYLSFTPPITHPHQMHIKIIGGEIVHPWLTIFPTPFLQEWVPRSPCSTPSFWSSTLCSATNLRNALE